MIRELNRWLVLSAGIFLLSGCSWFGWLPWVDGDDDAEALTKPAELVKFEHEIKLDRNWKASIGQGLGQKYLRLSPAVVADRVVAADGYGIVEARNRFTGKRIWRSDALVEDRSMWSFFNIMDRTDPSFVSGGVGVGGGLVLLGTTHGEVIALNVGDGSDAWTANLGSEVLSVPVVHDGSVYTQTIDGRLVALDQQDGTVRWTYDNQVPILTLRGTSSPVVQDDIVYAGFANGKIIALRTQNGEPIWEHRVMLPEGRSELDRIVDVDSRPLVSGAAIFIAAYQGRVKGLSKRDGRPRWEKNISSHLDLAEGYGQIYVVDDEDVISAIDQQTGEVVWTQESFKRRKLSPPTAFSNYLVVGDEEGYLHVIAQRDGRLLGRRKLDGDGIRSSMLVVDTTLFVVGNSGGLHALNIELK